MMGNLKTKISDIKAAILGLKAQVAELDARIAEAQQRRHRITSEPVSMADFIGYLREDIRRKGERFADKLRSQSADLPREYPRLENMVEQGAAFPYLTANRSLPVEVKGDAMFFYFGDQMAQRIADAFSGLSWPNGGMPVAERKQLVASIDSEINDLRVERGTLVDQLIDAGLAG